MGESMDADHVATICLAHWPGQASEWLGDLRRIASYSPALGKFVTLDQYFRETAQPGQLDRFEADRYRSPYLKQAIIRKQDDPISSPARDLQTETEAAAAQTLNTLVTLVSGKSSGEHQLASGGRGTAGEAGGPREESSADFTTTATRLASALIGSTTKSAPGTLILNPSS